MQKLAELEASCQEALHKVPYAQDKLGMLLEYDIPTDTAEVDTLLQTIRAKYNDIMRCV